ncbi:hypothetical protein BH09BAC1_BH09BAC1_18250 [soil metagenome]
MALSLYLQTITMKKLFTLLAALGLFGLASAQPCLPSTPVAVFDSMDNIMGATFNFTAVPTGNVIKIYVPFAPVSMNFNLCSASNQGDSYLSLLNENSGTASIVGYADDGCASISTLTDGDIIITGPGTYYLYVSDYPCIADGASTYDIEVYSTGINYPNNDECATATYLPLNTLIQSTFNFRTYDSINEQDPVTGNPISNTCGLYPSETSSLVWFYFYAPRTSTYRIRLANVTFGNLFLYYDYAVYPENDIICVDMASSTLTNGICRSSSQGYQGALDTTLLTLEQGGYYIVVSKRNDPVDFSIKIEDRGYTATCGTEQVPGLTFLADYNCASLSGSVYLFFDSTLTLPAVGNSYGLFAILGTGPIANFQNPSADPNFKLSGRLLDMRGLELAGADIGPGTYYFYLIAAGNGDIVDNEYTFDTTCMAISPAAIFKIRATGDTSCYLAINDIITPRFNLYPNPATSLLNIDISQLNGQASYTIYNTIGKAFITGNILPQQTALNVDVNTLQAGYYLFTISGADGQKSAVPFLITK